MRVECPACSAVYDLPERLLNSGARVLRCAACSKTWSLASTTPPASETAGAPAPAPAPASNDRDFAALMEAVVASHKEDGDAPADTKPGAEDGDAVEEAAEAAAEEDPKAESEPEMPPAAIAAQQSAAAARPSFGLAMAWLATVGGLGALILTFALYPEGVVAHWPAAARLYEAVGITLGAS